MIGAPDLYWYVPANSPIKTVEDFNGKTVAYSLTGSSSHAGLLALIAQYKLTAKPTSTGTIAATITQTMTGQVDVGFGAAPFGLDLVEEGKIRIIATGNDVTSLRSRTVRVNLTNVNTLQSRREALVRFNRAYQETVAWMYSDPAALKVYGEYSNLPEKIVLRVRNLIPKESMATDRVEGIDQIMADAVAGKFIPAPLTRRAGERAGADSEVKQKAAEARPQINSPPTRAGVPPCRFRLGAPAPRRKSAAREAPRFAATPRNGQARTLYFLNQAIIWFQASSAASLR